MVSTMVYAASFIIVLVAFFLIRRNFVDLRKHDEGTPEMKELAGIIRDGASTFLRREYRVIIPTVILFGMLYTLFMEKFAGLTLLFGALLNAIAVEIGMRAGTYGNVRTTNAARVTKALSRTMRIALLGGSISGFAVPAFGLFGFLIIWISSGGADAGATSSGLIMQNAVNPVVMRLGCYSLGFSLIGMFNRVAGGNYTKAADISADIVGKNVHNMPEDDSRMPNTIADFIGDNVNDIAGNISDLGESFVATPVACILIAMQVFKDNPAALAAACLFPFVLSASGLLSSLVGVTSVIFANRKKKKVGPDGQEIVVSREISDPAIELDLATYLSAITVFIIGLVGAYLVFGGVPGMFKYGWIAPWGAAAFGVVSSVLVGKVTERYTGMKYASVQKLKSMASEGDSFVVTTGDAIGYRSTLLPVLIIGISMIVAYQICGTYGIAIAGLGMLSFVGTTVSIDAFGPIADNAGGIAESCHLEPEVREITDQLDAVGNTTAAIGKGNAIGSATFATVALIMSYIGGYATSEIGLSSVVVYLTVGAVVGGALIMYFSALLTDNTIVAAKKLADAGEEELKIPGVLEGTVKPHYTRIIEMAANSALKHMLLPSILALIAPIAFGFSFGPNFVLGILLGSTVTAVGLAIYNGNSGGAFDNAKKAIEIERSKDPDNKALAQAHKAAVTGDTVGDTRKDVVGVALDIFIKMMSTVSNTLAQTFAMFHLF
ncbi:sodium/proton-translocating pyrophosphatase [Candidatus Saccharibacteria bacterium]|nr:sodium/proton-translocating pyrophosphatase [Candidatus Saccharibacteria bacterium]MBR0242748.1 sodium/proton-translocating pyrophosphatase [Candidatus Saccharibacteria bacterium]